MGGWELSEDEWSYGQVKAGSGTGEEESCKKKQKKGRKV